MDDGVAEFVAEDELIAPHIQYIRCEVLLRDSLGTTFGADNLRDELGEDIVGLLGKGRRPEDAAAVQLCIRVVDALRQFVSDNHLHVMGQRHRRSKTVRHPIKYSRVPDLLNDIPIFGLDGVVLVDDSDPPVALCPSVFGVVTAETGHVPAHQEENREDDDSDPTQLQGYQFFKVSLHP